MSEDGKIVIIPPSLLPRIKKDITLNRAMEYIHHWPKLDITQAKRGIVYPVTSVNDGEVERFRSYLITFFDDIHKTGREALKQRIARNFRQAGYKVNGSLVSTYDHAKDVLKSDLMKNMDRLEVMKVMFRLIHSCNYETSDFVKKELPEIINARGQCPQFSMPFAIPNSEDTFRNHCLVRIANSGGDSVIAELRELSLKQFGMCISKYERIPKKLDAILVRARYFQEILFKPTLKSYLIVSRNILPENLQKKQDVTMEDLEKFFHNSDNGPTFCKHLYNFATAALVSGLSFNDAVHHLKETWDAMAVSMEHYPGLTPPEKTVVLGKNVHSPHNTSLYPVVARELSSHGLKEPTAEKRESNGSLPIKKRTTGNELDSVSHFSSVCISCLIIHSLTVVEVFSWPQGVYSREA